MQFEIDEILYYGGLGAVLLAVILGVILFMTFKYRKARLELKLMEEYSRRSAANLADRIGEIAFANFTSRSQRKALRHGGKMEYQGPSQYEVIEKIGTGGLGSVYLARHKNLNTKVVLKAEKLKKKINEVQLRREVDILKTLKSPYIPVVYDYFVQGDTAYTVMEYIEGETLEEYLERGESYRQPQIIKWAIQILEALRYLHSPTHGDPPRGYIHSDIKPANIMIRPNGEISLIDFNVSLAIGEESTIGLTRGYASPEHYGYVYTDGGIKTHRLIDEDGEERTDTIGTWQTWEGEERTDTTGTWQTWEGKERTDTTGTWETWEGEERTDTTGTWQTGEGERKETEGLSSTVPDDSRARGTSDRVQSSSGGGSLKRRKIAPDERSDLYSVGALLYHLVSGQKPAANVLDVVPLSPPKYNGQIAAIIGKAMNANPNRRYQSAGEMLSAFYDLKRNDARNKALKKQSVIAAALTGVLLAAGAVCAFIGLRRMQKKEEWLKLTEYSNEAYAAGDIENAIRYALEACPQGKSILTPAIREQTQVALTQALEVYKLSDGYRVDRIPVAPLEIPVDQLLILRLGIHVPVDALVVHDQIGQAVARLLHRAAEPPVSGIFTQLFRDLRADEDRMARLAAVDRADHVRVDPHHLVKGIEADRRRVDRHQQDLVAFVRDRADAHTDRIEHLRGRIILIPQETDPRVRQMRLQFLRPVAGHKDDRIRPGLLHQRHNMPRNRRILKGQKRLERLHPG